MAVTQNQRHITLVDNHRMRLALDMILTQMDRADKADGLERQMLQDAARGSIKDLKDEFRGAQSG